MNIICGIIIGYFIFFVCGMQIGYSKNLNFEYPNGDWALNAKNPKIEGNLLCAELKNIYGNYESSCIVFNKYNSYLNVDGKFVKVIDTLPKGKWVTDLKTYNDYVKIKKNTIKYKNNVLCAEFEIGFHKSLRVNCIYVEEGDNIGICFSSGKFYKY